MDTNPPILNVNNGTGDDTDGQGDHSTGGNDTVSDGFPPCFTMKGYAMWWLPYANGILFLYSLCMYIWFACYVPIKANNLISQTYSFLWISNMFMLFMASFASYFSLFRQFWYSGGIMIIVLMIFNVITVIYGSMILVYNKTFDLRTMKEFKNESFISIRKFQDSIDNCMTAMITCSIFTLVVSGIAYFNCYHSTEISRFQMYIKVPDYAEVENAFGSF